MVDARVRSRAHAYEHGEDAPEIVDWQWSDEVDAAAGAAAADTGGDNE